ncbi:MAG: putative primosomal protein n [Actinomycetota bacterium]
MTPIARVVVDVTGVDKPFDYAIPDSLADAVVVGSRVRVPLHRREVPGWVAALLAPDEVEVDLKRLLPIRKVTSIGPAADIVELIEWASVRWASRRRPFFVSASPPKSVARLVAPRYSPRTATSPETPAPLGTLLARGGGVVRCGPTATGVDTVLSAAALGPVLVVAPTIVRARGLAAECRRNGLTTAVLPDDWVAAASGVDIAVGARSAVWASVRSLAAIVVIDEHDDTLQEERSPTWHAREVAIERARGAGIPCLLVSPVPTVSAMHWAGDRVIVEHSAAAWPRIRIIDRNADERWASSLVTSPLIELLRDSTKRVVCVLNVKGRARAMACDACRTVARCETCGAAVAQSEEHQFDCPRCEARRPAVCLSCGSQKMRAIRIGITRLRDELEAAAGRPVQEVRPTTDALDPRASVFVGTEAVLHRIDRADAVVFLDIDSELLAPRFRASEQALDLLLHGARLVPDGELVVQTTVPHHEVLAALVAGDLSAHQAAEAQRRRRLSLPPFGALAEISGPGTPEAVAHLRGSLLVQIAGNDERALVRAATWDALSEALLSLPRGKRRVRVAVDPARV